MWFAYLFALVLVLGGTLGCTERKSGYCQSDSDCTSAQHCQFGPGVDRFTCVGNGDGGPGGDGGLDSGDAAGCQTSQQCPATSPICLAGTCSSCAAGAAGACAARDSTHPVCFSSGACVQCATSADCSGSKPICDTNANICGPCTSDSQCSGKGVGPGICMAHQDGRCATDAETVYVQFTSPCNTMPTGGNGTAGSPYCNLGSAFLNVSVSAKVFAVIGTIGGSTQALQGVSVGSDQVSFIGQGMATIVSPGNSVPNVTIDGATVYMRDLSIDLSADIGMSVKNGATIQLDTVTFDSNAKGGLLIDSSSFDVGNCTFTNNGPGTASGGVVWGGIRVQGTMPATKSLTDVTVANNKQLGLSCAWPVDNSGVYASANIGGVDVSPTCGITPCPAPGPGCGAM